MGEIAARTIEIARQLVLATNADVSVRRILESEIRRRMNRYELMDRRFHCKYRMRFEEFHDQRVVEEQGYSFEVESNYCAWEMPVTGLVVLREHW